MSIAYTLEEEELSLIIEALSFQFKYNYSSGVERLLRKLDPDSREGSSVSTKNSFEIYKTMVVSTRHVEQDDFNRLEYFPEIFSTHDHYYGTRILITDDLLSEIGEVTISEGLRMLILFATSCDCRYLELDSDGPTYKGFPEYDW